MAIGQLVRAGAAGPAGAPGGTGGRARVVRGHYLFALVFTAGIGENAPVVRERSCQGLQSLGIEIDNQRNREHADRVREVSAADSRVKVLVVPTNEELRIAQETRRAIGLQPEKV